MYLDPERVKARMGKCYHPDCEGDPEWYNLSWHRYCKEHVPDENDRPKGQARLFHRWD